MSVFQEVTEIKGKDPDRCVFRVTNGGDVTFHKLYFNYGNTQTKYEDFQREYFITQLLTDEGVNQVVKFDSASIRLKDNIKAEFAAKAPECQEKIDMNPNIPFLSTKTIDPKAIGLGDWIKGQPGPIDADIIKTFSFQLLYLVAKIQSRFGIQHNDLYEENIMVLPVEVEETLEWVVGGDLFRIPLKKGHLKVYLFDFGASTLKKKPGYDNKGNQWEMVSLVALQHNNPPEVVFSTSNQLKHSEADAFMIGHVLLSMIGHGREDFKYQTYLGVHVYDITVKKAKDLYLDGKTMTSISISNSSIIFDLLGIKRDKLKANELFLVNLVALSVMFEGVDVALKEPPAFYGSEAKALYNKIATYNSAFSRLQTPIFILKDYVSSHFKWLKDACELDSYRFSLLRRLMAFDVVKRRSFSTPGTNYCLTAALFHPYFQSFYSNYSQSVSTTNLSFPFAPPLEYSKDTIIIKSLEERERAFYARYFVDYLASFPDSIISKSIINDTLASLPETEFAEIAKIVYPSNPMSDTDAKTAIVDLYKASVQLPAFDQEKVNQTKKAAQQAEETRKQAAEKAAKEQAEAAEALRKKNEADAAAALATQKAQEAADKAKAETDALKKAAEEAEAKRLAEEQAKKEAEKKAAADKAAKEQAEADAAAAQAAAATQAAEEAAKKAAATQAAEEEAARQAAEAKRLAEEQAKKAKPITVPPQVADATLNAKDLEIIAKMRSFMDKANIKFFNDEDKITKLTESFKAAYNALQRHGLPAEVTNTLESISIETGIIESNLRQDKDATKWSPPGIQGLAGEILVAYYLIYTKNLTKKGVESIYGPSGNLEPWTQLTVLSRYAEAFNKKLGNFYNDIGLAGTTTAPASLPEEKEPSDEGSTQPGSIAPSPGPEVLVPKKATPAADVERAKANPQPQLPPGPAPGQGVLKPTTSVNAENLLLQWLETRKNDNQRLYPFISTDGKTDALFTALETIRENLQTYNNTSFEKGPRNANPVMEKANKYVRQGEDLFLTQHQEYLKAWGGDLAFLFGFLNNKTGFKHPAEDNAQYNPTSNTAKGLKNFKFNNLTESERKILEEGLKRLGFVYDNTQIISNDPNASNAIIVTANTLRAHALAWSNFITLLIYVLRPKWKVNLKGLKQASEIVITDDEKKKFKDAFDRVLEFDLKDPKVYSGSPEVIKHSLPMIQSALQEFEVLPRYQYADALIRSELILPLQQKTEEHWNTIEKSTLWSPVFTSLNISPDQNVHLGGMEEATKIRYLHCLSTIAEVLHKIDTEQLVDEHLLERCQAEWPEEFHEELKK